ncbi:MAG: tRNA lysidine(34) synthetase TilS, partial [Candidatus Gastranaerophilales bacterium]|nr:tRNA lysidine(34) synthetase TilS [Candidatus Gastranaerophilales bacterium]
MIDTVKNFIKENNLENANILIGLSGGVDSAVLFDILCKLNLKLKVIHLNHNWRGENSKKDEEFVKKLALSKNIEFYSETLSPKIKKTETGAREARYDFFARCQKKFNADAVFLAHNKNDNVETLIYRLVKGTGPSGLNSIPKIRGFYYRPLLDFERTRIEDYAKKNNIKYVVDKSNFDTKYKRNLIREKIIPSMKEINKEVIKSISNFIE